MIDLLLYFFAITGTLSAVVLFFLWRKATREAALTERLLQAAERDLTNALTENFELKRSGRRFVPDSILESEILTNEHI